MAKLWPYATPGIPNHLLEQLPGIPVRRRRLGYLRLRPKDVLWDIAAGSFGNGRCPGRATSS